MVVVAAFYQFAEFPDFATHKEQLAKVGCSNGVRGSILLAHEGINGTIAGPRKGVDAVLSAIRAIPVFSDLQHKESTAEEMPFRRLKIRLKKEIVAFGVPVDAVNDVGDYVEPEDWNRILDDPELIVVDARNDYETAIGMFDGSIDPDTKSFRDLPTRLDALARDSGKDRIAMYCTGGIRCEKATAYARQLGFKEIYHLKGGILKYLERVPAEESRWKGECFVFDDRVALRHGLQETGHTACRACGRAVSVEGRNDPHYEEGVSCRHCYSLYTDQDRERFRERHRQMSHTP
ncbi:MAG: rhodanese-related sulfurtransferase [Pseudomonadota bacterium]